MDLDTHWEENADKSITYVVPFCITNIVLEDIKGSERKKFTRRTGEESGEAFLLKNVEDKKSHYEADVVKIEDATAVLKEALAESGREEVLFHIHGWMVSCRKTINKCVGMNNIELDSKKKYLVLPVLWAASWRNFQYRDERREAAPEAGKDFRVLYNAMANVLKDSTVKKSLLCHSMGNYVLRIFAQGHYDLNGEKTKKFTCI